MSTKTCVGVEAEDRFSVPPVHPSKYLLQLASTFFIEPCLSLEMHHRGDFRVKATSHLLLVLEKHRP